MKYLLDTNICVHFLRGKFGIEKILKEKELKNCYISEITVLELRYGAENSVNKEKSHNAVADFVKGLGIIPIFGSIQRYAEEKVRLNKLGTPQNDDFDLLIGVTSVENQLVLVTENTKDFEKIKNIVIENWVVRK